MTVLVCMRAGVVVCFCSPEVVKRLQVLVPRPCPSRYVWSVTSVWQRSLEYRHLTEGITTPSNRLTTSTVQSRLLLGNCCKKSFRGAIAVITWNTRAGVNMWTCVDYGTSGVTRYQYTYNTLTDEYPWKNQQDDSYDNRVRVCSTPQSHPTSRNMISHATVVQASFKWYHSSEPQSSWYSRDWT